MLSFPDVGRRRRRGRFPGRELEEKSMARASGRDLLPIIVVAAVAGLAASSFFLPVRWVYLGSELLIAILFASSLNLLMGYGGLLSFGHAAYYALAAYASGLLFVRLSWSMELSMLAGPVVAALGAFVFGLFIMRGNRGGQDSGHGREAPIEPQFTQHEEAIKRVRRNGADCRHKAECDGQIEMAAFFGHISGRKIDRDASCRQSKT